MTPHSDAEVFFGMPIAAQESLPVLVKEREDDDENRYTEDMVERYYLWASWLYKFDKDASKKEFEKAWRILSTYIRHGAGDEPGLWNITPRYQAARIAGWLDRPKEKISYMSQLLSGDATQGAQGNECRMRYYHFHRERGHLPRNLYHDLTRINNRLYERVYGKTMSGEPTGIAIPPTVNFPESKKREKSNR